MVNFYVGKTSLKYIVYKYNLQNLRIMKKIKYMFIGAMMTVIAAPAMAQTDASNIGLEVTNIIKTVSDKKMQDKQVTALAKPFKKDAKALAEIGRAYLGQKDFDNAKLYGEKAVAANKKAAAGYILLGEIASAQDDGGTATMQYQQAMYADPKDPEGYRRYASAMSKVSPSDAVATLEKLRQEVPSYPVDLVAAEIQSRAGKLDLAISYYDKVDKNKMEASQLTDYALDLFLTNNFEKSLSVSSYGNDKFPRYGSLNRLTMYNQVNLKNYDEAVKYGDRLFNESDSAKFNPIDYQNYGVAKQALKKYDEAVAAFETVLGMEGVNDATKNDLKKNISDAYKEKGDYANAGSWYQQYLDGKSTKSAYDMSNLASIYTTQANDANSTPEEKAAAVAKADEVYAMMVEKFPSVADFATYQRSHLPFMLDPEDKEGKAAPHYQKLIELVNAKAEKGATETKRLKESYQYLTVYYLKIANDTPKAKEYAALLQSVDPENELAATVLGL